MSIWKTSLSGESITLVLTAEHKEKLPPNTRKPTVKQTGVKHAKKRKVKPKPTGIHTTHMTELNNV